MATTVQSKMPNEMRAIAGQSVEQAKAAFDKFMQSAHEAVSAFERHLELSQSSAMDVSKKAMTFAEQNALSAFELAQKIVQARDIQEVVRMQSLFVQSQMRVLTEQVQALGKAASMAASASFRGSRNEDTW